MDKRHDVVKIDELDLRILESVFMEPEANFKELAKALEVDQRTVAKRLRLLKRRGVLQRSFEIDWNKLGFEASAIVGATTAVGERAVGKLIDFIRADPRVVEAYQTVGESQYLLRIIQTDLQSLRDTVLRDLEPLTSELVTFLLTSEIKRRDYPSFVRFFREVNFPRSRGR